MNLWSPTIIRAAYERKRSSGDVTVEEESLFQQFLRSLRIDEEIEKDKEVLKKEVKVLVLGSADSGKSTLVKQMRLTFGSKYEDYEILELQDSLRRNIVNNTIGIVKLLMAKNGDQKIENEKTLEACEYLLSDNCNFAKSRQKITTEFDLCTIHLKHLWADDCFRSMVYSNYIKSDNIKYFFENLDRICDKNYKATNQDILKVRSITTGVWETTITYNDNTYRLIDVGGQKSERRKWIHCFDDVTAIIFCVSLSSFDYYMVEDKEENQLEDSIQLFQRTIRHSAFEKTPIFIFFNKNDLFSVSENTERIKSRFPEVANEPGDLLENTKTFIKNRYIEVLPAAKKKDLYCYFTCAIDANEMKSVFKTFHGTVESYKKSV